MESDLKSKVETQDFSAFDLDSETFYPLKECWGILKAGENANIKAYLCDCGMEVCIYCFIE